MSISLGGIALPDLIWEGEFDWSGTVAAMEMTLGGKPVIWEAADIAGRPIDLVASLENGGWLTRAVVQALMAKAATLNWTGVLDYEGTSYLVRFRNEEPPAIEINPIIPRPNHAVGDYYTGRIKLMEV